MECCLIYYNHINKEMFHLHFVLFKKSDFVMMSLNVLTLVMTGLGALRESKIRGKFNL